MTTGRRPPSGQWRRRLHGEPTIQELLDDPVIEAVMARDGVRRKDLVLLIDQVRLRLQRRESVRELAEAGYE
jgi:hypothetical protein